ncbi:MAG: YadA-like family protein [Glaciimonas sp.]|nr:YadA-like family protein [Glaciimonas sp.]
MFGITRQITNVKAGTEDNDAVNLGQMNEAIDKVGDGIANAVKYDDASKQKMTLEGSGGSVIDNLANGKLAADSKQAVNGGQLYDAGDKLAQALGGGASMGANGLIGPMFGIQGGNYYNVGDALGALDGAIDSLGNRIDKLENGNDPAPTPTPVKQEDKLAQNPPPVTPPTAGDNKDGATQDQIDDVKKYSDDGDKKTLGDANKYTDQKVAGKVSQSDFNEFKGDVDKRFDMTNKKIARVGAMSSAMAGMVGAIGAAPPNANRISAALGAYGGQTALSLGYAKRIGSNAAVLVGGSVASGGELY